MAQATVASFFQVLVRQIRHRKRLDPSKRVEVVEDYFRFHSERPILGCASFIVIAILVFLNPLVYYVELPVDNISLVAVSSSISLLLDPLFLYAPLINEDTKCLVLDNKLKIIALVFRSWGDLRYIFRIFEVLYNCWHKRSTRENRQELASNIQELASNMMSVLPIPQIAIFYFLPNMRGPNSLKKMRFLNSLIVLQYVFRVYPLFQLCNNWNMWNIGDKDFTLPTWSLIFVNTYGYLLAAYIIGAFWYFFSIMREIACWEHACRIDNGCEFSTSCAKNIYRNITLLEKSCHINLPDKQVFDFGVFRDALQSGMQRSTNFWDKCLRCFAWGIRNLSSFGSNLNDTSTYGWENLFVVLTSILGLALFLYLLGHVEKFMQKGNILKTTLQKMDKSIGPKIEIILFEYGLPKVLEKEIKRAVKQKLLADQNHIVENMFSILSLKEAKSFATNVKCTLFLDKLKKVDELKDKGEEVWIKICKDLEPVIYNEGSYIIREGEPLDMVFFVTWGSVLTYATGSNGSSGTIYLQKEKYVFYGEQLLTWAEAEQPSKNLCNLPISSVTVKSHQKAEIFALKAIDLWSIFNTDNTNITIASE